MLLAATRKAQREPRTEKLLNWVLGKQPGELTLHQCLGKIINRYQSAAELSTALNNWVDGNVGVTDGNPIENYTKQQEYKKHVVTAIVKAVEPIYAQIAPNRESEKNTRDTSPIVKIRQDLAQFLASNPAFRNREMGYGLINNEIYSNHYSSGEGVDSKVTNEAKIRAIGQRYESTLRSIEPTRAVIENRGLTYFAEQNGWQFAAITDKPLRKERVGRLYLNVGPLSCSADFYSDS